MKSFIFSLLLLSASLISKSQVSFTLAPGAPFVFNNMMRGAISADMNNDGHRDLLMGSSSSLYVGLGNGTGQFANAPGTPINTMGQPLYIAVADFNNDGLSDVATANYNTSDVSIFLGVGAGSLVPANGSPITTSGWPYCIAAADFNMDGKTDLVTSSVVSNEIFLLIGNGSGSFSVAAGFPMAVASLPYHVSAADFNADNFPDLAFVSGSGNTVDVRLGNGTGGFSVAPGSPYSTGSQPRTIAVKDLDNSGTPDMVITNYNSNNLSVLLGVGNGSFAAAPGSPVSGGSGPYQVTVADFNLNGVQDIAFTNAASNNVMVKLGVGNGQFTTGGVFPLGSTPQPICTSDFNNDGKADLAIGDWIGSYVNVLINAAEGGTITGFTNASQRLEQLNIYPNPTSGKLNINLPEFDKDKNGEFILRGVTGQIVLRTAIEGIHSEMDLSTLPDGLYIYEIRMGSATTGTGMVVVENSGNH